MGHEVILSIDLRITIINTSGVRNYSHGSLQNRSDVKGRRKALVNYCGRSGVGRAKFYIVKHKDMGLCALIKNLVCICTLRVVFRHKRCDL